VLLALVLINNISAEFFFAATSAVAELRWQQRETPMGWRRVGGPFFITHPTPRSKGLLRKKYLKATYIWQIATKSGTMVPSFFPFFEFFLMAFLCVSQQGEFKNTIKTFGGKAMSKKSPKSWGKELFPCRFFPFDFFYRVFLPFLCMRSSKIPLKYFPKIRPKNLKQKVPWYLPRLFLLLLFLSAPCPGA
jgi:hypothetical protein